MKNSVFITILMIVITVGMLLHKSYMDISVESIPKDKIINQAIESSNKQTALLDSLIKLNDEMLDNGVLDTMAYKKIYYLYEAAMKEESELRFILSDFDTEDEIKSSPYNRTTFNLK